VSYRSIAFLFFVLLASNVGAWGQGDPTQIFNGVWVAVNPPGPHIVFNTIGLGQREASLPILGQARISTSNGEDGSNFRISGPGFTCFYLILTTNQRSTMVWELRSGPDVCFKSAVFAQADNPTVVIQPAAPSSSAAPPAVRPPPRIYPSFPCSVRLNETERAVCSDNGLAQLDLDLDSAYTSARSIARNQSDTVLLSSLSATQYGWRVDRRDRCAADLSCVASAYRSRINQLNACIERLQKGGRC
jgi:hypothetical protein